MKIFVPFLLATLQLAACPPGAVAQDMSPENTITNISTGIGISVPDHTCGHGPVLVTMEHEYQCSDYNPCKWITIKKNGEDIYKYSCPSVINAVYHPLCTKIVTEAWTDWPECDGKKMDVSDGNYGGFGE